MANELTINVAAECVNGSFRSRFDLGNALKVDQAAIGAAAGVVNVGTSEEDLAHAELSVPGYAFFRNLDTTNYVTIGPKSGGAMVPLIKLKAGEVALMRLAPSVTIRAAANTAAIKLQMLILET